MRRADGAANQRVWRRRLHRWHCRAAHPCRRAQITPGDTARVLENPAYRRKIAQLPYVQTRTLTKKCARSSYAPGPATVSGNVARARAADRRRTAAASQARGV